jgi:hypothetical protein
MPLNFVALLHPKPDRVARVRRKKEWAPNRVKPADTRLTFQVEEIARKICEYVQENEPGVLQYRWFRAGGTEKPLIVVWET